MRQRQPPGTHWPPFEAINGFVDANVEEHAPNVLQLWIGNCCGHCTPSPWRLRFEGVTHVSALDEDLGIHSPLFRLASAAEIRDHQLVVPADATAFCIVTEHGSGRDGPLLFVVAQAAHVL